MHLVFRSFIIVSFQFYCIFSSLLRFMHSISICRTITYNKWMDGGSNFWCSIVKQRSQRSQRTQIAQCTFKMRWLHLLQFVSSDWLERQSERKLLRNTTISNGKEPRINFANGILRNGAFHGNQVREREMITWCAQKSGWNGIRIGIKLEFIVHLRADNRISGGNALLHPNRD